MLTPAQIYRMKQYQDSLPDARKRSPIADYYEGYFFVTLNANKKAPRMSIVCGNPGLPKDDPNAPRVIYLDLGMRVMECWRNIPRFHPHVTVIAAEVMPDHFHGLLHIRRVEGKHLGRVIGGFMIGCTHAYWDVLGIPWRDMKSNPNSGNISVHTSSAASTSNTSSAASTSNPSTGTIVRETAQSLGNGRSDPRFNDPNHTQSFRGPALFFHGYNDVIPITEAEVQIKKDYINAQAEKRLIKEAASDSFNVNRNQHSKNWNTDIAVEALSKDPFFARTPTALEEAKMKVKDNLNDGLDYVGDKHVMAAEKKLPLVCHRADAPFFANQKEAVLSAARSGYVIVSAFISSQEREIRDALMEAKLPVIEIKDNGFSQRYKPSGKAFYACAESYLVQITCWKYAYTRESKISRERCLVMNELARIICKQPDGWWKTWKI